MSQIAEFLTITFIAIVFQNAVMTRGLGSSREVLLFSSNRKILWFGGLLTCYLFFSGLLSWPFYRFLRGSAIGSPRGTLYFYSITTLLCCCAVFAAMFYVTRAFLPRIHYYFRNMRVLLLLNCAVLGSILVVFRSGETILKSYNFIPASSVGYTTLVQTLGFCIGSGIGYTAALILVNEGRRRLSLSDVPKAFKGLPATLLYVGIFSLAIYGLTGHSLPT